MSNLIIDLRQAQNLITRLACHLAIELDLHNDIIDAKIMADELADLLQAREILVKAEIEMPEVITHVLVRAGLKIS